MKTVANNTIVTIEGARLLYRDFRGTKFQERENEPPKPNISVLLDPDLADQMARDGWNIKYTREREDSPEGWEPEPHIKVLIRWTIRPPKIIQIGSRSGRKIQLTEDTIDGLDWAVLQNVDLSFRAYNYDRAGNRGVTAYLDELYVTIEESVLAEKYGAMVVDEPVYKDYDDEDEF